MTKTVLILAANPKDTSRLRLDQEVREIDNGLQRARRRDEFILRQVWAVRRADFRRAMLDLKPNIVHFCGHGSGEEGIAFEDENGQATLVSTDALTGFFELFADKVECVVLNACYSEVQASAIAKHIPYVIGMKKAIGDAAAIEFAVAFYDALGAGESVEFAHKLACNAIQLAGLPESLTPIFKSTRHPSNILPPSVVSTLATKGALSIPLRSQVILDLGFDDGIRRVKKKGFFNVERNKQGRGIFHQYERLERQGENLVIDHTTGLTWQQSGSPNLMSYSDAKGYIDTLNGQRFAGYSDWRLPTLDEAMSLMEPEEKNGDLYIDSVFDETQTRIWIADQSGSGGIWKVSFFDGICEITDPGPHSYVRAVR